MGAPHPDILLSIFNHATRHAVLQMKKFYFVHNRRVAYCNGGPRGMIYAMNTTDNESPPPLVPTVVELAGGTMMVIPHDAEIETINTTLLDLNLGDREAEIIAVTDEGHLVMWIFNE
jgi:hypothetical protein